MDVIKKDGRVEPLEENKIRTSIANASANTESILNESDINILVKDIIKKIEELRSEYGNTSSYELIGTVIDVLKRDGFDSVISSYIGHGN